MQTRQPMFKPNGDGGYDVSPAGVLLLCAETYYGPPQETTPAGMVRAKYMVDDILAAARKGGYLQAQVLETLLARNQVTPRLVQMAEAATDAAGMVAMQGIFEKYRLD